MGGDRGEGGVRIKGTLGILLSIRWLLGSVLAVDLRYNPPTYLVACPLREGWRRQTAPHIPSSLDSPPVSRQGERYWLVAHAGDYCDSH